METIENSEIQYISEHLIKAITSKLVDFRIKTQLQRSLETMLEIDSQRENNGKIQFI